MPKNDKLMLLNGSLTSSAISLEQLQKLEKAVQTTKKTSPTPPTSEPGNSKPSTSVALQKIPKNKGALENIEEAAGGREALIDNLLLTTLDKKQQHFLNILADPARAKDSISTIARDSGLKPLEIIDLFRSSAFAAAHAVAMGKLATALPSVVDDLTAKSIDSRIECPQCLGEKNLTDGVQCPMCWGKGEIFRASDLDRQKIVLESTGVTKKGAGMAIQVNQNVGVVGSSALFSKYVKASDDAAYDVVEGQVRDGEETPTD